VQQQGIAGIMHGLMVVYRLPMVAVLINGCERGFFFLDGFLSLYDVPVLV
jgi:hypothetical protein